MPNQTFTSPLSHLNIEVFFRCWWQAKRGAQLNTFHRKTQDMSVCLKRFWLECSPTQTIIIFDTPSHHYCTFILQEHICSILCRNCTWFELIWTMYTNSWMQKMWLWLKHNIAIHCIWRYIINPNANPTMFGCPIWLIWPMKWVLIQHKYRWSKRAAKL